MKKVIILKGLPASGKSTWAKKLLTDQPGRYKRVNKDDLRAMLDNGEWSPQNEKLILKVRDNIILASLANGYHVVVDDTNLHPKHEAQIRELVKGVAEIEVKMFEANVDECIKRDLGREKSVGEKVIRDMHKNFLKQKPEPYRARMGTPIAVMCDIDGTLALMRGRSPFDWQRVDEDAVNESVKFCIQNLSDLGVKIILLSGRDEACKDKTVNWLGVNGIPWDELYMRPSGNNEKDSIVKRRIFDEKIRDRLNVRFVLDDRNQVVEMWRDLGLTCFQVAEGDF